MKNYTVQFGSGNPQGFTGLAPTFLTFWNLSSGTTNTPPSIAETIAGKTGIYTFAYGTTQAISFLLDAATTSPGTSGRYVTGQLDPADRADEYGTTLIAYGLSLLALGTTSVAIGTTGIAIGTTGIAQGTTSISFETLNFALGTTAVALGITGVAFGTLNFALGTTGVALGITGVALGTASVALGTTAVALGITSVSIGLSSPIYAFLGSTSSSIGSTNIDPTTVMGFLKRAQEMSEGGQIYTKATGVIDFYTRASAIIVEKTISDTATTTTKT